LGFFFRFSTFGAKKLASDEKTERMIFYINQSICSFNKSREKKAAPVPVGTGRFFVGEIIL
jgi:hypothetical protein